MLCEKILGKLSQMDCSGKKVEYVDIEWHEAFRRIHRKTTDCQTEVGIRLDDSVLTRGLVQDDVIYQDETQIIAVRTPPCEIIRITFEKGHEQMAAKVCYEIGNRHAPLFWGSNHSFVTIYNEPMYQMLKRIHGAIPQRTMGQLDFERRISASVHNHHH